MDDTPLDDVDRSILHQLQTAVPSATTFISGLEWLHGTDTAENEISRNAQLRLVTAAETTALHSSSGPHRRC